MSRSELTRRGFLRAVGAASLGACAWGLAGCRGNDRASRLGPRTLRENDLEDKVVVVKGEDIPAMVRRAVDALGGMKKVVRPGDEVVVKPNIGWDSTPDLGACTHPLTVATLVTLCVEAGAKRVKVFDRACRDERFTYKSSGIAGAARKAGATVLFMSGRRYSEIDLPKAKLLTRWPVYRDALEADVVINVPAAKVHNTSVVTLAMKNLMGVAGGNRGSWHPDIYQKLADFLSAVPCDLTVIDAYRIMVKHGPDGGSPTDLEWPKTIVAAKDLVAADAYVAAELFGRTADEVRNVKYATEMGLGQMDYKGRVEEVRAA